MLKFWQEKLETRELDIETKQPFITYETQINNKNRNKVTPIVDWNSVEKEQGPSNSFPTNNDNSELVKTKIFSHISMKALRLRSMLKKTSEWGIKSRGTYIQNDGGYGFEDNWPFVYKQLSWLKYIYRKLYLYETNETRRAIDIMKNNYQSEELYTRKQCKNLAQVWNDSTSSSCYRGNKNKLKIISNHIMILGFKPGIEYIIQSVRSITDAPIWILANSTHLHAIKRMIAIYENCHHFVGQPYDIKCLANSNIEKWQFWIVVSEREESDIIKDSNAVLITNLLEEWYPSVKFWVELTCKESVQMIENTVFKNNSSSLSNMFSISYMSNKVLDVTMLYKLTSYLWIDPLRIKFLDLILKNEFDNSTIHPMKITSQHDQKLFGEFREELLNQSPFKMLWIGVYTKQIESEINNKVMDFLNEHKWYEEDEWQSESFRKTIILTIYRSIIFL